MTVLKCSPKPGAEIESALGFRHYRCMDIHIRTYQPSDLAELKRLTLEGFEGIAIDQKVEEECGILNGHDWRWRKSRHVDEDVMANPAGIFVAEAQGLVVGYISTRVDRETGKGRIPNLAVGADSRGHGLGRRREALPAEGTDRNCGSDARRTAVHVRELVGVGGLRLAVGSRATIRE